MIDFFKSVKWSMLLIGLVSLAGGIMIALNPSNSVETIIRILGGILVAGGVLAILAYLLEMKSGMSSFFDVIVGVIILAIGLALLIRPKTFETFINIIFAVVLGVNGLNMMVEAIKSHKFKDKKILTTILMGLISIGLAVLIYFNPFTTANTLMFVIGIALIVDGLLLSVVSLRRGAVVHKFHVMEKEALEAAAREEERIARETERLAKEAEELRKAQEEALRKAEKEKEEAKEAEDKAEEAALGEEVPDGGVPVEALDEAIAGAESTEIKSDEKVTIEGEGNEKPYADDGSFDVDKKKPSIKRFFGGKEE